MPAVLPKVLYLSHAPREVYDIIRAAVPAGFELVTLDTNDDAERKRKIRDCEVVVVGAHPLRRDVLDCAERLRFLHHQGVGYQDTLDVEGLRARRIPFALTPEGTTTGVAEHTVLLMLAILKQLPFADEELRQGRFHVNALRPVSRELAGMTIGYVGMGRIAQAVAARLRAFETTGVYHDPAVLLPAARASALALRAVDLDTLLATADIVTLHAPLTRATRHLLGREALARMKPGAYLVNTARGGLVDETALAEALETGRIAGAALDVFETEPLPAGHRLSRLRNVVLTPHISAGTRDALATKMRAVFANVERFYRGEPLANEVRE